jgi:hypothetical protein
MMREKTIMLKKNLLKNHPFFLTLETLSNESISAVYKYLHVAFLKSRPFYGEKR